MLEELGVFPTNPTVITNSDKLAGKSFCITGTLSKPRTHFEQLISTNGGVIKSGVTKKLDYLLVGVDAGSKLLKARSLNINIINEEQLNNLIN
jgi:DNA ligase (NAD+)